MSGPEKYYRVRNGYTFFPESGPALQAPAVFVGTEAHIEGQTWKVDEISRAEYLRDAEAQAEQEAPGRRRVKGAVVRKAPADKRMSSPPERPVAAEAAAKPPAKPPGELVSEAPTIGRPKAED